MKDLSIILYEPYIAIYIKIQACFGEFMMNNNEA